MPDAEGRLYSGHNGGETRGWHFVQSGIYLKQSKDPGKFGPPTNPFAFGELPMMNTTATVVARETALSKPRNFAISAASTPATIPQRILAPTFI